MVIYIDFKLKGYFMSKKESIFNVCFLAKFSLNKIAN